MRKVLVLMSTYNGEKYLKEQIQSLICQQGVDVEILIRDDGSTDSTIEILKGIKDSNINVVFGKNVGYAKSFMELITIASKSSADYFAFCDQDDVWKENKLLEAVKKINEFKNKPALYLSQADIVDDELNAIETSFHKRKLTLGAVLQHNYAIGCTMVFNRKLRELLDRNTEYMELRAGHDTWVFTVAMSIDAYVFFDINAYIKYRQHGNNASGKILSIKQAINAVKKILFRWKGVRSSMAKNILFLYKDEIILEEKRILLEKASLKKRNVKQKCNMIFDKKMYSDYLMVDFLYFVAIWFDLF